METVKTFISNALSLIRDFFKITVKTFIVNTLKLIRDFFMEAFIDTLIKMLFGFAKKERVSKVYRVNVYTITLLPLTLFFVICILTKYNVESILDTVMLYIFTILTLMAYVYSLKVIFKKV